MWSVAALALAGVLLAVAAHARVEARSGYSKQQTFSGALRYLRVDLGYEIVEKDPDAAYLIFRYQPPGRRQTSNGSVEVIETAQTVKVLVQLPQMPRYHEAVLRDGLMRKLREEYGEPPPRKREPEPEPEPKPEPDADAGTD
jgi:hypothetical protein